MRKGGVLLGGYPIVKLRQMWWVMLLKMIGGFTGVWPFWTVLGDIILILEGLILIRWYLLLIQESGRINILIRIINHDAIQ